MPNCLHVWVMYYLGWFFDSYQCEVCRRHCEIAADGTESLPVESPPECGWRVEAIRNVR